MCGNIEGAALTALVDEEEMDEEEMDAGEARRVIKGEEKSSYYTTVLDKKH